MSDFNPMESLQNGIAQAGGGVNAHAHLDRFGTLTPEYYALANSVLSDKWGIVQRMNLERSVGDIYDCMARGIELMICQGVQAVGTFIDVDAFVKDKAIEAARRVRETFQGDIEIFYANQVLSGVLDKEARQWFDLGAEFVDIIGGLPAKDRGRENEHLDVIMQTAQRMGKLVHVHVDQNNTPTEMEMELLADKTLEHSMEDNVVAVHGISLSAHPIDYRESVYAKMQQARLSVIACPTAWIDGRKTEVLVPTHNSITAIDELIGHGITVAVGTDNIRDVYKPFSDGNLLKEVWLAAEACRYYNIDELIAMATISGLKVLNRNYNEA